MVFLCVMLYTFCIWIMNKFKSKAGPTNVVPSYEICFEKGWYVFSHLNAVTFCYPLTKNAGSFDNLIKIVMKLGLQT